MKIRQLIKHIPEITCIGSKDLDITGLSAHSKTVAPGYLFIAKRGRTHDGTLYIRDAIATGASCCLTDMYDPTLPITQLIHKDVAFAEACSAAAFYQHPHKQLTMIGITGTAGKTSTAYAIKHLLDHQKYRSGIIGTIEYITGEHRYPASHTTPDVIANYKMLREMVRSGCKACVMEVTSHALDQQRVRGLDFDLAIFTNMSHEHLDYHGSMESYFEAKYALFCQAKAALINADCPWGQKLMRRCQIPYLSYGIDNEADIKASAITSSGFTVTYRGRAHALHSPLLGRHNVYNALAAMGACVHTGHTLEGVTPHLATLQPAPGRLEPVPNTLGINIFVDYSHKPEPLKVVLQTLRHHYAGRLITVFGCGGDRDREKRPLMGRIAEELSDVVIVTSDNPRSEVPEQIIQEITQGFMHPEKHLKLVDRKAAIEQAIAMAKPQDTVLIAGKGHETKQYFGHSTIDFDDREIANTTLLSLRKLRTGE